MASQKGYDIGITGEKTESNVYDNEVLQESFILGYNEGLSKYIEEKTEEYTKLGYENGKSDIDNIDINNIDEEFRTVYTDNFNKGQEELSKEYKEKGYMFAFTQDKYKSQNYKKEKYNNWYKEGYEKGTRDLENLKESAYNDGYEDKYEVPTGMEHAEKIYSEYNLKGKEDAKKENTKNIMIGSAIVALVGIFGFRYFKTRK